MTEVETLFEPLRRGGKMNYLLEIARAVFETGWDLFIEKSINFFIYLLIIL